MANAVASINGIAIANIAEVNGITDTNLAALNGLEFTGFTDGHVLLATATASSDATLSFTSGISSTYDIYEFHCIDMHPQTTTKAFTFQVNAAGGATGFNEAITSAAAKAFHYESGDVVGFSYETGARQRQGTAYQKLSHGSSADADASVSGVLRIHNPSSTTFVKLFSADFVEMADGGGSGNFSRHAFCGGYINVAGTAIDEISFKFESGDIDTGAIKMYGVKTS